MQSKQNNDLSIPTQIPTLRELVNRFLQSCRQVSPCSGRRLSPKTLEYYHNCLGSLLFFADGEQWPEPTQLTRRHLRDYMDYLSSQPQRWAGHGRRCSLKKASPATVYHYLKVAKTFFRWCEEEEYIPDSPVRRLRLPSPGYKEVEPYSDEELKAVLAALDHQMKYGCGYLGVRNKAIIALFIDTGLRLSELTDMKLSHLEPQLRLVRIMGKGAKYRTVPISGQARKLLKLYLKEYRPPGGDEVWLTEDGEPLASRSVKVMISRLHCRAGIKSGGGAHRFRHYFATRYLENGGDMNSLRLLLGHTTLHMMLRYTRFVKVNRALDHAQEFSPFDSLLRCGSDSRQEAWGWRP